ncbi:MAG: ABC transporter permease [Candidatus Eisenbacteria bacterium]
MQLFRIDPLTKKRLQRFRRIKRGYYSFLILVILFTLSLFSEFIANDRALAVKYDGKLYFPTLKFYPMATFGQQDEYGFDDVEANYLGLKTELRELRAEFKQRMESFSGTEAELIAAEPKFARKDGWVLMPMVPFDPYEPDFSYDVPPPNAPDGRHWFGTDGQGRDVFARLLYGFRISMVFALLLVVLGQTVGTIIGSLQGYIAGRFDLYGQRFIEIWGTLPFLYVVIIISAFFIINMWKLIIIFAIFQWIRITYYMRTEMYREKTREYCLAARSYGASSWRIMFRHLLPNCLTPLVTFTPFFIVGAIGSLTALDYLGFGLPAPTPSWGELIDQALQSDNRDKVWLSIAPFGAISITLVLVTFVGESVREAFDPKQFARYK